MPPVYPVFQGIELLNGEAHGLLEESSLKTKTQWQQVPKANAHRGIGILWLVEQADEIGIELVQELPTRTTRDGAVRKRNADRHKMCKTRGDCVYRGRSFGTDCQAIRRVFDIAAGEYLTVVHQ